MTAQNQLSLVRTGDDNEQQNQRRIESAVNGPRDFINLIDQETLPDEADYEAGSIVRVADAVFFLDSTDTWQEFQFV